MSSCSICGHPKPRKDHFKRFVRKVNPCSEGTITVRSQDVVEYYRLAEFTPSRVQLMRYQTVMGRPIPTKWDPKEKVRKQSMDEKALKGLISKYPLDKLYPLVLIYRELDKVGGTYIGRYVEG